MHKGSQQPIRVGFSRLKRMAQSVCIVLFASTLLSACSGDNHKDLEQFVAKVKARRAARIAPLPEFKTYETFTYNDESLRDPFAPSTAKSTAEASTNKGGIHPDRTRHKEALEAFELNNLKFVGRLQQGGRDWGIISAPDGLVYRVQVGNHIGQHDGKIYKITDSKIDITEIVPDGLGGWVKRNNTLSLAE